MKRPTHAKLFLAVFAVLTACCLMSPLAVAQQDEHGEEAAGAAADGSGGLGILGLGIGAGLAVGLAGLGTGLAQSGVGAGGTGAIAERPELFGQVLILFAIPETIVLFGFVIGILLFTSI